MSFAVRLVTVQTLPMETIEITKLARASIWWPMLPGINVTGFSARNSSNSNQKYPLVTSLHYPANAVISARASGSVSNRPIAANSPSKLASDNGCTALLAQSRNLSSS